MASLGDHLGDTPSLLGRSAQVTPFLREGLAAEAAGGPSCALSGRFGLVVFASTLLAGRLLIVLAAHKITFQDRAARTQTG